MEAANICWFRVTVHFHGRPKLALESHACRFYDVGKAMRMANGWQREVKRAKQSQDRKTKKETPQQR